MEVRPYLKSVSLVKPSDGKLKYPFSIPAINALETLEFHRDVTFIIGENGSGKSTLVEAIAAVMNFGAQGGTGNFSINDAGGTSGLENHLKPKRSFQRPKDKYFLRAESFYNVATYMDKLADENAGKLPREKVLSRYGGKSLHARSHGESFMSALVDGFGGQGFYVLDEPEAALSPLRQQAALVRIHQLVKDDSQFIIATHSPILMSYPNARIYLLDEGGSREVAYEETEHFKVTRDFLNNYKSHIKHLLSSTPLLDLLDD
jgi:predicted ATPase